MDAKYVKQYALDAIRDRDHEKLHVAQFLLTFTLGDTLKPCCSSMSVIEFSQLMNDDIENILEELKDSPNIVMCDAIDGFIAAQIIRKNFA